MIPQPIASEIVSYFNLSDLLAIALVNKAFNKATHNPAIWKREFMRLWMSDEQFNSENNLHVHSYWKELCLKGLKCDQSWKNLSGDLFTDSEISILSSELQTALKFPQIPFLPLRRDINSFPTLLQDMFGNPYDQIPDETYEGYVDILNNYLHSASTYLCGEIQNSSDLRKLAASRWNLVSNDNISEERISGYSESTCDTDEEISSKFTYKGTPSFLLKFYKCLTKNIDLFCKGICMKLIESTDIISDYACAWNNFVSSANGISYLFSPISELINEIYEVNFPESEGSPKMTFMRYMITSWRRNVFSKIQDNLTKDINEMIDSQRLNLIDGKNLDYLKVDTLRMIVECLMDISLNELNVYFKNHSRLQLEGPYEDVHLEIISNSHDFYSKIQQHPSELAKFFDKDHEFLSIFLPNSTLTHIKIQKMKILLNRSVDTIIKEFESFNWKLYDVFGYHTKTELSKILLSIEPNMNKILAFFQYCKEDNSLSELMRMIEFLYEEINKDAFLEEDIYLERRAELAQVPINIQPEKLLLYSTCRDFTHLQITSLIKAYTV